MRIALVHDWLVGCGGGERVLLDFHKIFPDAPIYTLVYDKKKVWKEFEKCDIRTTYIQRIPFATKLYKNLLPLMPGAWERLDLTEYDLILSSCSSCCKGIITRPDAIHICYCHSPTRYLWDFTYTYLQNSSRVKRWIAMPMLQKLRIWDRLAADRVDYFLANSAFIKQRIQKYYRRDAEIIHPGIRTNEFVEGGAGNYYLVVSRLVYYKRIDLAIQACNELGRELWIVGCGEEEKKLRAMAGPTVRFVGKLNDKQLKKCYEGARAFLFPGEEDFGITPLEAQSAGVPVLAYGRGGALETVLEGKTGMFFYNQTPEAMAECIRQFEAEGVEYSASQIHKHSLLFSDEVFRDKIRAFCQEKFDGQDSGKETEREGIECVEL